MAAARLPARSDPVNSQFLRLSFAADNRSYLQSVIMRSTARTAAWGAAERTMNFA